MQISSISMTRIETNISLATQPIQFAYEIAFRFEANYIENQFIRLGETDVRFSILQKK